jgi:hypothetical protein|tara:strand:- start:1306 stop:1980 length:675 start_codon:yes stop_codon:yes gene_type:complete
MKTIEFIKSLVEQELREINGGIMDPNMVPFVPHQQSAQDTANPGVPKEPTEADRLYKVAVGARLATEDLVKALEHPIYDEAYEAAFKATMALRDALNKLESVGAEPENDDRIVAPSKQNQPLGSNLGGRYVPMTYTGNTVSEGVAPDIVTLNKLLSRVDFAGKVKELIDKPIEAYQLLSALVNLMVNVDPKVKILVLRKVLAGEQSDKTEDPEADAPQTDEGGE